jgi:hypothetical protein
VVLPAGGRAAVVGATALDALGAPFRAHEVGERQGIFRYVGLEVVAAKAAVRKSYL